MTRRVPRRRPRLATAVVLLPVVLAGCTSTVTGTPTPTSADSAPAGVGGGDCQRTADPDLCRAYTPVAPVVGEELYAAWAQDPARAAAMVCSALPDTSWQSYLGPGFYRVLEGDAGQVCSVYSDDEQFAVKVSLYPPNALREYLDINLGDPQVAARTQELDIAGYPAMRTGLPEDSDGVGPELEDLTLAPSGDAHRPGVVAVQLHLSQPRGRNRDTPVDRARMNVRDPLIGELFGALFRTR